MKVTSGVPGSLIGVGLLRILVPILLSLGIATALLLAAGPVEAGGPDGLAVPIILEESRPAPKLTRTLPEGSAGATGKLPQGSGAQSNTPELNDDSGANLNSENSKYLQSGSNGEPNDIEDESSSSDPLALDCVGENVNVGECRNLTTVGSKAKCGGTLRPWLSREEINAGIDYRCHMGYGIWVRYQQTQRYATDSEIIWDPITPCDRQKTGLDPFRNVKVTRLNDSFSDQGCTTYVQAELDGAIAAMQQIWGDDPPVSFCHVIYVLGGFYGTVYAISPDASGTVFTSTPIYASACEQFDIGVLGRLPQCN